MKKLTILIMTVIMLFGCTQDAFATEHGVAVADNDPIVIVLDAGHDTTHGGARANGLSETKINLKIAQYCYEELCTYSNVKVYMTRTITGCPYPEALELSNGPQVDNRRRVDFAASVDADAYIALHLNACEVESISGAEVFIPDTQYLPEVGKTALNLGKTILKSLSTIGLEDRGTYTRLSEDGTLYPDGSLADYYGVIKRAKELGFTGIIVEHAYITSPTDVANHLSTDEQIKKIGVADAKGIADYYGLVKDGNPLEQDTLRKVEFMKDGVLVCTQYVRDGYDATELDAEYMEIAKVTYGSSLKNITADTVIEVDYIPASEYTGEPDTEAPVDTETESESEAESETEDVAKPGDTQAGKDTNSPSKDILWILVGVCVVLVISIVVLFVIWWNKKKRL